MMINFLEGEFMAFFQFINNKCVICKRKKIPLRKYMDDGGESSSVYSMFGICERRPIEGLNEETNSLVYTN